MATKNEASPPHLQERLFHPWPNRKICLSKFNKKLTEWTGSYIRKNPSVFSVIKEIFMIVFNVFLVRPYFPIKIMHLFSPINCIQSAPAARLLLSSSCLFQASPMPSRTNKLRPPWELGPAFRFLHFRHKQFPVPRQSHRVVRH